MRKKTLYYRTPSEEAHHTRLSERPGTNCRSSSLALINHNMKQCQQQFDITKFA